MTPDPLNRWPSFVGAVHRRLHTGRSIYGDRSFSEDPAKLLAEIEAELLDVAGWAFVLWTRISTMRSMLASLSENSTAPAAPPPNASAATTSSQGARMVSGSSARSGARDTTGAKTSSVSAGLSATAADRYGPTPQGYHGREDR